MFFKNRFSYVFQSSDEGVDVSFPSPTGSAPFCPHYTDCTCLTNRWLTLSYAFTVPVSLTGSTLSWLFPLYSCHLPSQHWLYDTCLAKQVGHCHLVIISFVICHLMSYLICHMSGHCQQETHAIFIILSSIILVICLTIRAWTTKTRNSFFFA